MPADEQKLDEFHGSTGRWLYGSAAGLGTSLLVIGGFVLLIVIQDPLALIATAVGLLIILWKWLQNMTHRYTVTSQRLVIRSGIVMKSIDEVELYRVKDVKCHRMIESRVKTRRKVSVLPLHTCCLCTHRRMVRRMRRPKESHLG